MKLSAFEQIIRKVVREEIDYALRREITALKEELSSNKPIIRETKNSENESLKEDFRSKIRSQMPSFNSGNSTLDSLLSETALAPKLINVLLTSPGERLHHPNFGAGLKNRLFQQNTPIAGDELRSIVTPQVERYVPEITIKNIALRDGGLQGHILYVTVNYSLNNNDEEDSVSLSFTNENFNNEV
ncbi:MAG: GPW/gp25 family protein [Minisyncoccia bacterium]